MAINKVKATTPIYGKNLLNNYSLAQKVNGLGTWYVALGMWSDSLPGLHK